MSRKRCRIADQHGNQPPQVIKIRDPALPPLHVGEREDFLCRECGIVLGYTENFRFFRLPQFAPSTPGGEPLI